MLRRLFHRHPKCDICGFKHDPSRGFLAGSLYIAQHHDMPKIEPPTGGIMKSLDDNIANARAQGGAVWAGPDAE